MERIESIVDEVSRGARLDRFLADARPEVSRNAIQREIREGRVFVAGEPVTKASHRLHAGDAVTWTLPEDETLEPKEIPLSILYEDDAIVAVDKPAGLVVHPGAGSHDVTLVEALLYARKLPESDDPARPGIVHRLDKETSGVLVVAKTSQALASLQRQFASRTVSKAYIAVLEGVLREDEGAIDAPVGRDPSRPSRMTVLPTGRPSQTEFDVLRRLDGRSLVIARPRTGRTHQLRAHFSYIDHPVAGDTVYGRASTAERTHEPHPSGSRETREAANDAQEQPASVPRPTRLLLHAWRLAIRHPESGEEMRFETPIPPEFPDFPYYDIPWSRIPDAA
jgi:23S rRNA pseudouridine1911/1915/1917 synthase